MLLALFEHIARGALILWWAHMTTEDGTDTSLRGGSVSMAISKSPLVASESPHPDIAQNQPLRAP